MTYVAAIQMVSTDAVSTNLEITERLIREAVNKKAKLVTLPENFPLMGKCDEDRLTIVESFNNGPLQLFLSEQSKKYKIWLLGGTIPLASSDPKKFLQQVYFSILMENVYLDMTKFIYLMSYLRDLMRNPTVNQKPSKQEIMLL